MSDVKMEVDVNVRDRILKPVNEVFAAFVDPAKMSQYFISGAPAAPWSPALKSSGSSRMSEPRS